MNAVNPVSTASGAEPSMEEILASIRRIIADDQSLPGHAGVSLSAPQATPGELPIASEAAQTGTEAPHPVAEPAAPTMAADLPPDHGIITTPQFVLPEKPASVMDTPHPLAPQTPAASSDEPDLHEEALRILHDEPSIDLHDFAAREPPMTAHDLSRPDVAEPEVAEPEVAEPEVAASEVASHDAAASRAAVPESTEPEGAAPDGPGDGSRGLFSPATSQSLAAAFNTLAVSRLADDSQELRHLAQDMLQPLLKKWLDENLPSMVEGIIRDEIDRMSRRGR